MASNGKGFSRFLIDHRWGYIILSVVITILGVIGAMRMEIRTHFSDLLPEHSKVIDVFKEYEDFSAPLNVQILLHTKKGTIFTPDTLAAIFKMTRDIDLLPNIDHNTVLSIASSSVRVTRATPSGVESFPVMPDVPPKTAAGAAAVRAKALVAQGVIGILVSPDHKSTIIEAGFHEKGINYQLLFDRVHQMIAAAAAKDPNLQFYPAGRIMLIGWVYHYGSQALWIFLFSFLLIALAHIDYMRSLAGAGTPLIVAALSTVWGVGAGGWMGLNLEPLTLVVPVLLMARALSHSIQMTRRYYEVLYERGDQLAASAEALSTMFPPAALGILCDVVGLYLLMMVPIPIIQKLGLFCGTWSLLIVPTVVLMTPVLLAVLPPPRDVKVFITREVPSVSTHIIEPLQKGLAQLIKPGWRIGTAAVIVPMAVVLFYFASHRAVGNAAVGSPLLRSNNEFNIADQMINHNLAGTVTLNVIWEGKRPHAMKFPGTYESMRQFQRNIEREKGAEATFSMADYLPATNRLLHGGNPKWIPVDLNERNVAGDMFWTLTGHSLTDFAALVRPNLQSGDVILWYKDLRSKTVAHAMNEVQKALAPIQANNSSKDYKIRLAGGAVAMQYAMDQVVQRANLRILIYLLAAIFAMAALTYQSFTAGLVLIVPLVLAQFATDTVMYLRGVGLDVNTLPVIAVGLGVGIDYGIYLLSRMCDEYQTAADGDVYSAVVRAVFTTGEATFFVAFTMVVGVLPWYFLSGLKFLADMGLMLALVMAFNAILALVVIPVEVVFIKPKFLGRVKLMRH
jgi:predicted RND superfamily exporter protein